MSRSTLIGIGIATIILIVVVVWLVAGRGGYQVSPPPTPYLTPAAETPIEITPPEATATATPSTTKNQVTATTEVFTPATIEIPVGGTVTWVNDDDVAVEVRSTPHPIHTDYPPLNSVGVLQPGQSKSLTFPKEGTYRYHNHLNPAVLGTVVVK